ncbi:sulfotransferase [Mesorhizobium sp. B2-6-2]|uniref:tetratricopeptide repeat-containing sulfotransferase family protein n=1 Tax=Mesorhizobium sp. B2-6-2 TaxID=2589915 RepID=UPI00112A8DEF|nr:sulfotransferase [Mesorhizobium sp. B2-6-2]TPJ73430.1 tetratricopeptide repeat protein [Mesorhizobium sp. B2-6-2]
MSSRLPPAWAKHLKSGPTSKPQVKQPALKRPKAEPPGRTQAVDQLLKQALQLHHAKRLPEAEELCHRVLELTPNNPLALYVLGAIGLDFDDELAIEYLSQACSLMPDNSYFQFTLGEAYLKVGEYSLAIEHLQRAYELKPDLVEALCALGQTYALYDKTEMALTMYEKALAIDRDHPLVRLGLARMLMSTGQIDEATIYLEEIIARRENLSAAYVSLVNSRTFSTEPPQLKSILGELSNPAVSGDQAHDLHQAAGKVLNDLGRYDEAMEHFLKAKSFRTSSFDIESYRGWVDSMISLFDAELLAAKAGFGDPSEVPVFVLGMPRSGTTLTEQICSSHPDVHGAGELTKLSRLAVSSHLKKNGGPTFGQLVRSMTVDRSQILAGEYLSNLCLHSPVASRIVDKMPHNFELIGLIGILFPNARIIHCRRDPIDSCLSCFVSNLTGTHNYTDDLRSLGLYYREYDRLMRHWKSILPGRIFEISYEDLIADQEEQSRRLIDHLGLAWDDACLRFFAKRGSVQTLSSWQVRQPIYSSSVKRWRNYQGNLQPLIEALGDLAYV